MMDWMNTHVNSANLIELDAYARISADDTAAKSAVADSVGGWLAEACRWLLLAGFACLLVSCATIDATTTQYVGAPRFPPRDPAAVEILRTEPMRPHERLGEIAVDASTEPAPPIAEVEAKLRAEAAKLGADAVVVVLDRVQPVGAFVSGRWFGRDVDVIKGRKVVGVAIRYRR